jgi:hypothetical protein
MGYIVVAAVRSILDVIGVACRLFARRKEESKPGGADAAGLLLYRNEMPDVFVEPD